MRMNEPFSNGEKKLPTDTRWRVRIQLEGDLRDHDGDTFNCQIEVLAPTEEIRELIAESAKAMIAVFGDATMEQRKELAAIADSQGATEGTEIRFDPKGKVER